VLSNGRWVDNSQPRVDNSQPKGKVLVYPASGRVRWPDGPFGGRFTCGGILTDGWCPVPGGPGSHQKCACVRSRWQPRALALTLPAAAMPSPGDGVAAPGRGHLSASYVADPSVPVTGDAFLQLKVGPPGASPSGEPGRVHAPAPAAITGSVCLPNRYAWIVGLEGGKAPLSLFSRSYDLPKPTGSAYPTSTAPPASSATRPRHGRLRTTGHRGVRPPSGPHRPLRAATGPEKPQASMYHRASPTALIG